MSQPMKAIFLGLVIGSSAQFLPEVSKADTHQTCPSDTGGSCAAMPCHPWRNAECVAHKCVCAKGGGTCAYEGRCDTAEDKKRTVVENDAQKAISHLQILAGLEKGAAERIAAQKEEALDAIKFHKKSEVAAAQEQVYRVAVGKAEDEVVATKEQSDKAEKDVADATAKLKGGSPDAEVAFGKAQGDKTKADAAVKKAAVVLADANKNAGHANTEKEKDATMSANLAKSSTACERDTSGICNALPCDSWRAAECVTSGQGTTSQRSRCLCDETKCAVDGMCVPADSFGPLEAEKRTAFVKALFEKETAPDKATLKTSESAKCEKETGHACVLGTCVLYDAWGSASCVNSKCVCSKEDACVIQGKCAHWTTSADLGPAVSMTSEPSAFSIGFCLVPMGALFGASVIGAFAFQTATRRRTQLYTEPLLEEE